MSGIRTMVARDPDEQHRASSPLELLFDLCFVVAVAQAAAGLRTDLLDGHLAHGLTGYVMVFFAIWWAWLNFTWFASAYDTDDVLYRVLTLVQIAGVLVLAAGIGRAFSDDDFVAVVVGYCIMRTALVAQWLRAGRGDPLRRAVTHRYALGIAVVQLAWIARLALPASLGGVAFVILAAAEMAVPPWAESAGPNTSWHPEHIAERYGLFTIIVLGECVASATLAVQASIDAGGVSGGLVLTAIGGLLLLFGLWWAYYAHPAEEGLRANPSRAFVWGYGHYVVFAALAALGAGLEAAAEAQLGEHDLAISDPAVAAMVAVPVAVFLLATAFLQRYYATEDKVPWSPAVLSVALLLAAVAATGLLGLAGAVLAMGLVITGLVAYKEWTHRPSADGPDASFGSSREPAS